MKEFAGCDDRADGALQIVPRPAGLPFEGPARVPVHDNRTGLAALVLRQTGLLHGVHRLESVPERERAARRRYQATHARPGTGGLTPWRHQIGATSLAEVGSRMAGAARRTELDLRAHGA